MNLSQNVFPRRYVKQDDVLDDWSRIEPYFDELRDRPIESPAALERWLEDCSELTACIEQVRTDRYVRMSCQTDDEERKAAYLWFVENIEPRCKPRYHELNVKYTTCPWSKGLPAARFGVLDRSLRASVELFRDENVPLQTEEAKLSQRYQELCGAQTVEFDGQELTMQQLAPYLEQTDRAVRQQAWEAGSRRRLIDADVINDVYDEMIRLRHQMAVNADCRDYREYAFKEKQRFDYRPEDCVAFHHAVERTAVPIYRSLQEMRRTALGVDPLRPWDGEVDVAGRPPLRPFHEPVHLCAKVSRVLHRLDPELGGQFDEMNRRGYLDLESRKGKAPGGYQATYEEDRRPFIFMNAVGVQRDVTTLLHEGGHAFHTYAARHDPLIHYRSSPIEFAEVASFGMELLTLDLLDEFYEDEELARAKRMHLERVIWIFPWVATIDAFQHFVYANPGHSRAERTAHWLELRQRFGGIADYSGYEDDLAYSWQRQLHLFQVPFYYIEYAIAKLGALQLWRASMKDRAEALHRYKTALALGGSRPLPTLFKTAGAEFDFSEKTLGPLMELVQEELEKLPV